MRAFAPIRMKLAHGLLLCFAVAAPASAQRWSDAQTRQPVPSGPMVQRIEGLLGYKFYKQGILPDAGDPNRAFDPVSGRNFFFDRLACVWKDAASGKPVPSGPIVQRIEGLLGAKFYFEGILPDAGDPNRAFDPVSGRNFVRKKCPAKKPKTIEQPPPGGQVGSVQPVKLDPAEQRILNVHNSERAAVGAPPLRWNPALEASATAYAQQLARTGQRVHAPREGRETVRENLNQGMLGWDTNQMMRNWLDEKSNFIPGVYPNVTTTGDWTKVSHYTQMIWPTTTDLGCGMASGSGYQWLVCRYSPGGNKDGKMVGQQTLKAAVTSYQWIDVKTGKPVTDRPVITTNGKTYYVRAIIGDPNRAYDPESGRNFARENGQWIDVKTGKPVTSRPVITTNGKTYYLQANIGDPNRAFDPESGRNFAREPVPAEPAK